MCKKDLSSYGKEQKYQTSRKRKACVFGTLSWIVGMLFMFVFIMSLMIVKVSSTAAYYQNQTTTTLRTRSTKSFNNPTIPSDTTEATKRSIETTSINQRKSTKSPVSNRTTASGQKSKRPNWKPSKLADRKMRADAQQQARERLQMQQIQHQQQYRQQQQQLQKHKHQQQRQQHEQQQHEEKTTHAISGENTYLVEHAGEDESAHEQPIYGTWRTKAKRPQPPSVTQRTIPVTIAAVNMTTSSSSAVPPATPTPTALAASAALTFGEEDQSDYQKYHVYERLPRRSSTMTPMRSELNDQIPRPPRLTSRRPSLLVRRQYHEAPGNSSYKEYNEKPKPFHFPYEGPLPKEFKKPEPERSEVNNIQEILQQLQLNGTPTRATQLVMMPTGLHIAGSFKNLKASGIANFFRSKRNKKPVQLTFPVPMPMSVPMQYYGAFQPPMYGAVLPQPYQRIALDQFYPFKPRSPSEINLLAMQQQLNANRTKNKKKKNIVSSNPNLYSYGNNLYMQQTNQRPDHFIPQYPAQWMTMNATQQPKLRRIPFKLNLDIYPVLPPAKDHIPLPVRTPLAMQNPYMDYSPYRYPISPPNAVFPYMQPIYNDQSGLYNGLRFRTTASPPAQVPQSSNMQLSFPEQVPKYSQQIAQQQQQQQYQRPPMNPQQNTFVPIDCIEPTGPEDNEDAPFSPSSNQIMVHLNVFPKPKPSPTSQPSTNPFYNIQNRNVLSESVEGPIRSVEPRQLSNKASDDNSTHHEVQLHQSSQRIARSDGSYPVDFDHPIVAADISDLPQPISLISNKLDTSDISPYYDHIETRNNFHYDPDPKLEQLASEAKAASLFRFPVEDLIQFQVDDAL